MNAWRPQQRRAETLTAEDRCSAMWRKRLTADSSLIWTRRFCCKAVASWWMIRVQRPWGNPAFNFLLFNFTFRLSKASGTRTLHPGCFVRQRDWKKMVKTFVRSTNFSDQTVLQSSADIKDVLLMIEKQKTQKILFSYLNRDLKVQFNTDIWGK